LVIVQKVISHERFAHNIFSINLFVFRNSYFAAFFVFEESEEILRFNATGAKRPAETERGSQCGAEAG
jgi:hypothetical protein